MFVSLNLIVHLCEKKIKIINYNFNKMKKLNFSKIISALFAACVAFSFASCSDDEDPKVVFPDVQTVEFDEPGEKDLTFTVDYNWSLASSEEWCTLKLGDAAEASQVSGVAGTHTVKVLVDENAWSFSAAAANLTMSAGVYQKVIATIELAGKPYEVTITDELDEMKDTIGFTWDEETNFYATTTINATPNFNWTIASLPSWIVESEDSISGTAGVKKEITFTINNYQTTNAQGKVEFADETGVVRATVDVSCPAMPEGKIFFGITELEKTSLTFGPTGLNWWVELPDGSDSEAVEGGYKFNVYANAAEELKILYYKYSSKKFTVLSDETKWFYVNNNREEGKLEITVDENTALTSNSGALIVVPKSVYDGELAGDSTNLFDAKKYIKPEYEGYFATTVSQEGNKAFKVLDADSKEINIEKDATSTSEEVWVITLSKASVPDKLVITPVDYALEEVSFNTNQKASSRIPSPNTAWSELSILANGKNIELTNIKASAAIGCNYDIEGADFTPYSELFINVYYDIMQRSYRRVKIVFVD